MRAPISLDGVAVHLDCWCVCLCCLHFALENPEDGEMYLLVPAHRVVPYKVQRAVKWLCVSITLKEFRKWSAFGRITGKSISWLTVISCPVLLHYAAVSSLLHHSFASWDSRSTYVTRDIKSAVPVVQNMIHQQMIFGRPYYRSSLWYSVSSVCRLWRFVLWQNGAS